MNNLVLTASGPSDVFSNANYICLFLERDMYFVRTNNVESYIDSFAEKNRNTVALANYRKLPKNRIGYEKMIMLDGIRVDFNNTSSVSFNKSISKLSFTYKKLKYDITFDYDKDDLYMHIKNIFKI